MEDRMRFALLAAFVLGLSTISSAQSDANWTYTGKTGPLNWEKLDPSYAACGNGHQQSPVDIHNAHLNKALQPIQFHYIAGSMTVENDGRTIIVRPKPGSYIVAAGGRYNLERIEFRRPSEHTVKGDFTDLEAQLVHRSTDGKYAILAVRFSQQRGIGEANAIIAALWEHLPTKAGATEKITEMVNLGGLLPADRGYWTYTGSLTTPPCTEGVQWFVFENEVSISRIQLRAFTALFKMNTRQVQDLHGRKIEANE
jgi:carbonic anhydrase